VDAQWTGLVHGFDSSQSWHYTFQPISALVQVSLSARNDHGNFGSPYSNAVVYWNSYTTQDGQTTHLESSRSTFGANQMTEVKGTFIADNCQIYAIVNFFIWPFVS
jgi:hypothetical protein